MSLTKWKVFLAMIGCFFMVSVPVFAADQNNVTVICNDQVITSDVSAEIKNGYTLIPLRALAESLGFTVTWQDSDKSIVLSKVEDFVQLQIGSLKALVNGQQVELGAFPRIVEDRTLVPLRFVSEAMGKYVYYQENFLADGSKGVWITDYQMIDGKPELDLIGTQTYHKEGNNKTYDVSYRLEEEGFTARKIYIGSTEYQVTNQYGVTAKNDDGGLVYLFPYEPGQQKGSMIFSINEDKYVSEVRIVTADKR